MDVTPLLAADAWWPAAVLLVGLVAPAVALIWLLERRRARRLQDRLEAVEREADAQLEQARRDLLAMGQRVMEAEKLVRRLGERFDALESARPAAERYGQLGELLAGQLALRERGEQGSISAAEAELRSLLRRPADPN
jgi:hypothetical protein